MAQTDLCDPHWRFADLEAHRILPPDEQNSALQVLAATRVQLLPARRQENEEEPQKEEEEDNSDPRRRLSPRKEREYRADRQRFAATLAALRCLADMPDGRFPVVWGNDPLQGVPPWVEPFCLLTPVLPQDARLDIQDEEPELAGRAILGILNTGRSLGLEPFSGGAMWRNSCRRWAVDLCERLLAQAQPSNDVLETLQQAFLREDGDALMLTHFRGTRSGTPEFFPDPYDGSRKAVRR